MKKKFHEFAISCFVATFEMTLQTSQSEGQTQREREKVWHERKSINEMDTLKFANTIQPYRKIPIRFFLRAHSEIPYTDDGFISFCFALF